MGEKGKFPRAHPAALSIVTVRMGKGVRVRTAPCGAINARIEACSKRLVRGCRFIQVVVVNSTVVAGGTFDVAAGWLDAALDAGDMVDVVERATAGRRAAGRAAGGAVGD